MTASKLWNTILAAFLAWQIPSLLAAPMDPLDKAAYKDEVVQWRKNAEQRLRADNGWLTLAGRFVMKQDENRFGTAADNDIVFPEGTGPAHIGSLFVEPGKITLKTSDGITMLAEGQPFTERQMKTDVEAPQRDWVTLGRLAMHVIERNGDYVLRLADNQSEVRKQFPGRVWYDVSTTYRVKARFVAYTPKKKIPIINVLGDVSDEPSPGYVEFALGGQHYRLDAIEEDDALFFIFRDGTSGHGTYSSGRFLIADKPKDGKVLLDFNKAYNPPCAFSEFTTCPLPPRQNQLKVRVDAGEKYRKKGAS
jgi:uncharacterized protein (DUF1684 family)